jgi:hypothetical protein
MTALSLAPRSITLTAPVLRPSVRVPTPIPIPGCSANVEGLALLDGFFHWLISSAAQALMGAEFGEEGDTTLKPRGSP